MIASLLCGALGCSGSQEVSLSILLRTDYQPVREFGTVEVQIGTLSSTRLARIDGGYVRPGEPLVTFAQLLPVERRPITVRLLRLGANVLAETTVYVKQDKDLVVTIAVTRDCAGVTCEDIGGAPARCLGNRCVDARCIAGENEFCEPPECQADSDCPVESLCALPTCESGVCFSDGAVTSCPTPQVCDVDSGICVDPPTACVDDGDCDAAPECQTVACALESCIYDVAADNTPCATGACQQGQCLSLDHCTNSAKDADETDVDCGGMVCAACSLGANCTADTDCQSNVCDTVADNKCEAANVCGNGKVEMSEVCDDGGTLAGDGCSDGCLYENGVACTHNSECQSGACDFAGTGMCVPAGVCGDNNIDPGEGCDDNNTMSGDGCSANCLIEDFLVCDDDGACAGGTCVCRTIGCTLKRCVNPLCADGVQNQGETGIDCGGPCPDCASGQHKDLCNADTQCQTGLCNNHHFCAIGQLALTAPVVGNTITDTGFADTLCESTFGPGWKWMQWLDHWTGGANWFAWKWLDGQQPTDCGTRGWIWIHDQDWECFNNTAGLTLGLGIGSSLIWGRIDDCNGVSSNNTPDLQSCVDAHPISCVLYAP